MVVIRPIALEDLDQIVDLAGQADFGLTTLPADRELLQRRILRSCYSFERLVDRPGGEIYLLVMEDLDIRRVVGTSGIVSRVGGFEPFYFYQIETVVRESAFLQVRKEIPVLHLVAEHDGPAEIGTLFLAPQYRQAGNGRLLSQSRFLFMAQYRQAFAASVIAELRGVIDESGYSPFWEAVGRHFFDIDFPKADYLSMKDKRFIAELMPTHPLYIPLLPKEAQSAIGQVHKKTKPALRILQEEGFAFNGLVDIFDAGPILSCPLDHIRTIRESAAARVADCRQREMDSEVFVLANTPGELRDFRACMGAVELDPGSGVCLGASTAVLLGVEPGERVRFAPLRPRQRAG